MSQYFYVVVNQVLVFATLMLIGFVMTKARIITNDVLNGLSKLIVDLLLPCLVISLILGNGITIQMIVDNRMFAIAWLVIYAVLCLLGFAIGGGCGLRRSGQDMFAVATMFCSIGFMGLPLIEAVFPNNSQVSVYLLIYNVIDQFLLWSLGLYLCTRHAKRKNTSTGLKNLMNPMIVGITVSLLILYFRVPVPAVVLNVIDGLGDCSRYLSLLYLGGLLSTMPMLANLTKPYVYALIVLKMTALPVAAYFVSGFFFDATTQMVIALILSLPPMVAHSIMARTYGGDERVAAETSFVGTIACLGTIPLVQFLINVIF